MDGRGTRRRIAGGAALAVALVLTAVALWWDGAPWRGAAEPTAVPSPSGSVRLVSAEPVGERGRALEVYSPALGRVAKVRLLLPRGWRAGSGPWPLLFLLHGCCDLGEPPLRPGVGDTDWIMKGEAERITRDAPVIVVMPEGGEVGFYSDWVRGPRWETFHLRELIPLLEREFGAGDRRAVAGLSMGGFGALAYAGRHPDLFQAAASFSGVVDIRFSPGRLLSLFRREGVDPYAVWGNPMTEPHAWAAHNPADLAAALRGKYVYVSCGNGEPGPLDEESRGFDGVEAHLLTEARRFVAAAEQAGVTVDADFYGPGTHTWPYWIRGLERALPGMLRALGVS